MKTIIKKWGNSLGVRIPSYIAKNLSLKTGSLMEISERENKIIIQPKIKNSLNDIVKLITDSNIHQEEFRVRVGNEAL